MDRYKIVIGLKDNKFIDIETEADKHIEDSINNGMLEKILVIGQYMIYTQEIKWIRVIKDQNIETENS